MLANGRWDLTGHLMGQTVRTAKHETSVLKILCCYKKVTALAVPMVMLSVMVLSVTVWEVSKSCRNFTLHRHFVE